MARKLIRACPVCDGDLRIKVLRCARCGTKIEGDFAPGATRLWNLDADDLRFVELFLQVRGNLREVEKRLGVSYSSARNMVDAINRKLGNATEGSDREREQRRRTDRLAIIARLERGDIDVSQATELLRSDDEPGGSDGTE